MPDEAMELIENMAASDIAILRDQTHTPTKKSLLELTSQDALLTQNKLLENQLEILTKTLSKLPQQLHSGNPANVFVMQVGGCALYGGVHELGTYMTQEEASKVVNYMANQNCQGYNRGGNARFHP